MKCHFTSLRRRVKKHFWLQQWGVKKSRITVILAVLADGTNLPPYIALKWKTMPKEHFPPGISVGVQEKGWMDELLMLDWMQTVWQNTYQ